MYKWFVTNDGGFMAMNENVSSGKWSEIKGEVRKAWGQLSDDEIEKTKGDPKALGSLIEQRYGHAKEKYGSKLADIFKRFETDKTKTENMNSVPEVKDSMKDSN